MSWAGWKKVPQTFCSSGFDWASVEYNLTYLQRALWRKAVLNCQRSSNTLSIEHSLIMKLYQGLIVFGGAWLCQYSKITVKMDILHSMKPTRTSGLYDLSCIYIIVEKQTSHFALCRILEGEGLGGFNSGKNGDYMMMLLWAKMTSCKDLLAIMGILLQYL